jgi:DNA (cytosine-5)-methyltransferase 1
MTVEREYLSVDLFAGGGGASLGIKWALGKCPIVAVNHDSYAIEMHRKNHPSTIHFETDVHDVSPGSVMGGKSLGLLWLSPDCTHFSKAKGGKPRNAKIRALATVAIPWAKQVRPRVICLENVEEIQTWGPLYPDDHPDRRLRNQPIPELAGTLFDAWVKDLENLGYVVEWRELVAADYGAPTTRKRLFLVARCDGQPIIWPEPTHGPGRDKPYHTAAEIIDWTLPTPSIFLTKEQVKERKLRVRRPLAENTQRRIAHGLMKYVFTDPDPYIVPVGGSEVRPFFINTRNGERPGQEPRVRDVHDPYWTVTAQGSQGAVVFAWMAKHYGGVVGHGMERPLGTITTKDHHSLCLAHAAPEGSSEQVAAFITKFYGQGGTAQSLKEPLHTIVTKARFGLVTVNIGGVDRIIYDIGMRMLEPRELARAQGFPDEYILTGTKAQQTARIGNSVAPQVVEALVSAQFRGTAMKEAA